MKAYTGLCQAQVLVFWTPLVQATSSARPAVLQATSAEKEFKENFVNLLPTTAVEHRKG
jgi:hypothetical protein